MMATVAHERHLDVSQLSSGFEPEQAITWLQHLEKCEQCVAELDCLPGAVRILVALVHAARPNPEPSLCPDVVTLDEFALGTLPFSESVRVAEHVTQCTLCCQILLDDGLADRAEKIVCRWMQDINPPRTSSPVGHLVMPILTWIKSHVPAPPEWYVGLSASVDVRRRVDAEDILWTWLREPQPAGILVLGDSGLGKTTLLRRLLWTAATRSPDATDPVLIPCLDLAREWMPEAAAHLSALALANRRLRQMIGDGAPEDPLEALMRERRVCFVFDGFSEIPAHERAHIKQLTDSLLELGNLGVTVIVASLEAHFEPNFASGRSLAKYRRTMGPDRLKRISLFGLGREERVTMIRRFQKSHQSIADVDLESLNQWLDSIPADDDFGRSPYWINVALRVLASGGVTLAAHASDAPGLHEVHEDPHIYFLKRLVEAQAVKAGISIPWQEVEAFVWRRFVEGARSVVTPASRLLRSEPAILNKPARDQIVASHILGRLAQGFFDELVNAHVRPLLWTIVKQLRRSLDPNRLTNLLEKIISQNAPKNSETTELFAWHMLVDNALNCASKPKGVLTKCAERFDEHLKRLTNPTLEEEQLVASVAIARETSILLDLDRQSGFPTNVRKYTETVRDNPRARRALASLLTEYYGTVPKACERIVCHLTDPNKYGVMLPIELLELRVITERYRLSTAEFSHRLLNACPDLLGVLYRVRRDHLHDLQVQDLVFALLHTLATAFAEEITVPHPSRSEQTTAKTMLAAPVTFCAEQTLDQRSRS